MSMSRIHTTPLIVALSLVAVQALAEEQGPAAKGAGYGQAGKQRAAACQVIAADDTTVPIHRSGTPTCFAWGRLVNVTAEGGEAVVCWTMSSSVAFWGAPDSGHDTTITDANGPGGLGACAVVPNGGNVDMVPGQQQLYRSPGARAGVCATPRADAAGALVYVPCRVNADCTSAGAGSTCTASPTDTARSRSCGFLITQTDTDGAKVCWRVDE